MAYGLIFDVDGVIADTESLIASATIEFYRDQHGLELTRDDFSPYVGMGDVRYTEGPGEKHGIRVDLETAIPICHANFERGLTTGENIEFPGVKKLIETAAADDEWRVAMATSSPMTKSEKTLAVTSVDTALFDAWIAGNMVKRPKPSAEIYVTAALAMRLPPTRCIAIEDAPNGIQAAKDACMKCIAVTNTFPPDMLKQADRIVSSLEEIDLEYLKSVIEEGKDEQIPWGARLTS